MPKAVANPVEVDYQVILDTRSGDAGLELLVDEVWVPTTPGMLGDTPPLAGDYLVTLSPTDTYVVAKDVFERKYRPLAEGGRKGELPATGTSSGSKHESGHGRSAVKPGHAGHEKHEDAELAEAGETGKEKLHDHKDHGTAGISAAAKRATEKDKKKHSSHGSHESHD